MAKTLSIKPPSTTEVRPMSGKKPIDCAQIPHQIAPQLCHSLFDHNQMKL
jgi:hypothetical protein